MFSRFKEFVLERNISEYRKFIWDYIKEVIVYKDYVKVAFSVVFSFIDNGANHNIKIKKLEKWDYNIYKKIHKMVK